MDTDDMPYEYYRYTKDELVRAVALAFAAGFVVAIGGLVLLALVAR